jgi:hypothetical protein
MFGWNPTELVNMVAQLAYIAYLRGPLGSLHIINYEKHSPSFP